MNEQPATDPPEKMEFRKPSIWTNEMTGGPTSLTLVLLVVGIHVSMTLLALLAIRTEARDATRQVIAQEIEKHDILGQIGQQERDHLQQRVTFLQSHPPLWSRIAQESDREKAESMAALLKDTAERLRTNGSADALEYMAGALESWNNRHHPKYLKDGVLKPTEFSEEDKPEEKPEPGGANDRDSP